ncbi:MAG: GNAT family N-acetyltransferase [Actinomycetota bacterium]|nr:GNAT family N-acetyltransferase [Actinomycetota bacterium]
MGEVRWATPDDATELVRLRRLMFEAMGLHPVGDEDAAWLRSTEDQLRARLAAGDLFAAVVEAPDAVASDGVVELAASGIVEVSTRIPSPLSASGSYAYLSSMSTDPRWRRRGYARLVIDALLDELRRRDVDRIELHATTDGIALYRSVGFVERSGPVEMQLRRSG